MNDESSAVIHIPGELAPGTRVDDRYEVRQLLGAGGFATVYRAFDAEIERDVAIKVLDLAMLKGQNVNNILARFRQEAKLAARIRHPSVVQIFDFGILPPAAQPYIVMEYLEGWDLEQELYKKGPMAPARALPLFCDALDALGEAHELGIVHKDLKPSNLFLSEPETRRERLRLVDFGIAHIAHESQNRLTATGSMLGTPAYIAPEYADSGAVSAAVDVYQMGLILVEMFTGKAIVNHDNPLKCLMSHVSGELYVPAGLLAGPLGPILQRALARDPLARYPDGYSFLAALSEVSPSEIAPVSKGEQLNRISPASGPMLPLSPATLDGLPFQDTLAVEAVTGPAPVATMTMPDLVSPLPQSFPEDERVTGELSSQRVPKSTLVVGALFMLGTLILCTGLALRPNSRVAETPPEGESTPALAALDTPAPPAEESAPKPAAIAVEEKEPVRLTIASTPSKAAVWKGDQRLGRTPYEHLIEDGDSSVVILRLDGYEDERLSLGPESDAQIEVELTKRARVAPSREKPEARIGGGWDKGKGASKGMGKNRPFSIVGEDP